jgi:hypothetical protein
VCAFFFCELMTVGDNLTLGGAASLVIDVDGL